MSTLHIISRSPADADCWRDCLNTCEAGDSLLLIESGIYAATRRPEALPASVEYLALQADCEARGLTTGLSARMVDDATFVQRCVQHPQTISWF